VLEAAILNVTCTAVRLYVQATNARIGELVQLLSPMFSEGGGKVDVERWLPQKGAAGAAGPRGAEGGGGGGSVNELAAAARPRGAAGGSAVGAGPSTPPRHRTHLDGEVGSNSRSSPRVTSSTATPNRPSLREVRVGGGAKPTSPTGLPPEFSSSAGGRPAWSPDWADEVVEKNLRPQTLNGFIEDLNFDTRAPQLGRGSDNGGLLSVSAKSDDDAWDDVAHPGRI